MLDTSLYPFSARFQCFANVVEPKESDEQMAKASLLDLQGLLPDSVNVGDNPDFLYFAANGAIAGAANANGDSISVEKALEIYPLTKNKYINVDHKKEIVVGTLLYPGLSEFGSNELITPECAAKLETFNLSLVGIVWKAIKKELVAALVESSDMTSPTFGRISLSWEIFFKDYDIAIGSKIIKRADVITDAEEKEKLKSYLKCNGGTGFIDGKNIYRVISGDDVIIGGYSFVTNPAADVEGVSVITAKKSEPILEVKEPEGASACKNIEKIISQPTQTFVNNSIDKIMTINKIEDISAQWDSFKQLEAVAAKNQIDKLFEDGIRAADEKWKKDLSAKDEALAKVQSEAKDALEQVQAVRKQLCETQERLAGIEEEKNNKVKAEAYNERMADLDNDYDLDDDDRQVLASKIKDLHTDDASYAEFKKEFAILAKEKSKAYKETAKQKLREEFLKEHAALIKTKADDMGADAKSKHADRVEESTAADKSADAASVALASATLETVTLSNGMQPHSDVLKEMTAAFTKGIKFTSYNKGR